MIQKETYSLENIKRMKDKYNVDPELAQRSIFALGLVETLSMVGTDFIFKGGALLKAKANEIKEKRDLLINKTIEFEIKPFFPYK